MEILTVLVLGAPGRIGTILRRHWPEMAPDMPFDMPVIWQTRGDLEGLFPSGNGVGAGQADGAQTGIWIQADPLDPQALADAVQAQPVQTRTGRTTGSIGGVDVVLCLAGVTNAAAASGSDMDDNSALAQAAVRLAAQMGARVLLASSAAVYGREDGVLDDTRAPDTLQPVAPYGEAKLRMELDAQELGTSLGVPVCALRIGNVAGVDAILGGWRPGFQLDRFADGRTPRRSYIGLKTLARVLAELVCVPDLPPALNVACPDVVEMGALLDAAGLDWTPRDAPESAIPEVRLSTSATERVTSFLKVECGAQAMVAQWRAFNPET
jgi:nucleoside-diphosphate-sugar epimerase